MKAFDYFSSLEQCAGYLRESCGLLLLCCSKYDFFQLGAQATQARGLAEQAAEGHARLARAVMADFLPPLHREDLLGLSQVLAGLTGLAAGCIGKIEASRAAQLPEGAGAMAKLAAAQAEVLAGAAGSLRSLKKTCGAQLEAAEALRALGREGQAAALSALGAAGRLADPQKLVLCERVIGSLGGLCEEMSRAGAVLETAAVKNI